MPKHYIVETIEGGYVSNEEQTVKNNKILLDYQPDPLEGVLITGYVELKYNKEIKQTNEFWVNYDIGEINFHSSLEGTLVNNIKYYSKGIVKYFDDRIALTDTENNWNSTTLSDLTNELANRYHSKEFVDDLHTNISQNVQIVICKEGTTIDAGNLPLGTIVVVR